MNKVLIDTNVLLRIIIGDIPKFLQKSKKFFFEIEQGKLKGVIALLVINEFFWVGEKFYDLERKDLGESLLKLLSLPGISCQELSKQDLLKVVSGFIKSNVDFTDFYLSFIAEKNKQEVASFDKDFQKMGSRVYKGVLN
jgi:predicted nucleic acid-binding protein